VTPGWLVITSWVIQSPLTADGYQKNAALLKAWLSLAAPGRVTPGALQLAAGAGTAFGTSVTAAACCDAEVLHGQTLVQR
jgi:hypothetical protein